MKIHRTTLKERTEGRAVEAIEDSRVRLERNIEAIGQECQQIDAMQKGVHRTAKIQELRMRVIEADETSAAIAQTIDGVNGTAGRRGQSRKLQGIQPGILKMLKYSKDYIVASADADAV